MLSATESELNCVVKKFLFCSVFVAWWMARESPKSKGIPEKLLWHLSTEIKAVHVINTLGIVILGSSCIFGVRGEIVQ